MQTRRTGTKFTLRRTGGTGVYIKGLTLKIRPKILGTTGKLRDFLLQKRAAQ